MIGTTGTPGKISSDVFSIAILPDNPDRVFDDAQFNVFLVREVDQAQQLARRLPDGPAGTALVQLAEYLAARCDALTSKSPTGAAMGVGVNCAARRSPAPARASG